MEYLNALYGIPGLGNHKMQLLFDHFGSGKAIWEASLDQLRLAGIPESLATTIIEARPHLNPAEALKSITSEGIALITQNDLHYPPLLKEIHNPPFLLYARGNCDCLKLPLLAIVGSRKLTSYGKQVAYSLAKDLARAGICVVSGLAFGIDATAHRGALDAQGKTIAILGNSVDTASIYPQSHHNLAAEIIASGGMVMSEFPIPTRASTGTFPARNRIMAGMSLGTIVIEAAEKSGSLITANFAVEYNRDVFAVPGSIFSQQSAGCNQLIKRGAKLVTCAQDILEEIGIVIENYIQKENSTSSHLQLSPEENLILSVLSPEPAHIDIIIKATKLETSTISSALAILEIKGAVKDIGGQNYIRIRND